MLELVGVLAWPPEVKGMRPRPRSLEDVPSWWFMMAGFELAVGAAATGSGSSSVSAAGSSLKWGFCESSFCGVEAAIRMDGSGWVAADGVNCAGLG